MWRSRSREPRLTLRSTVNLARRLPSSLEPGTHRFASRHSAESASALSARSPNDGRGGGGWRAAALVPPPPSSPPLGAGGASSARPSASHARACGEGRASSRQEGWDAPRDSHTNSEV